MAPLLGLGESDMTDKITCELFLCINEDGNWTVGTDAGDTAEELADGYGCVCIRTVKLIARIAPPDTEEAKVDIPDDVGSTVEASAEAEAA